MNSLWLDFNKKTDESLPLSHNLDLLVLII